jgi:hypothetical protein
MCLHPDPGNLLWPRFFELHSTEDNVPFCFLYKGEDGVPYMFVRNLVQCSRVRFIVYNFFGCEINLCSIFLSVVSYGSC